MGATCHIIAERWLSNYKIVYRYEVGIPVLKGAGDNVLPTRGMVDLECKVGQTKGCHEKGCHLCFGHQRFEFVFFA